MNKMRKKESGVTLLELVIAMAIFFILSGIAIPNFLVWLANYRFNAAVRDLYHVFLQARLMSIRMHSTCTIVFNQPVPPDSANSEDVYDYVVYVDDLKDSWSDNIGCMELEEGEQIITKVKLSKYKNVEFGQNENGNSITFNNNGVSKKAVSFVPTGFPQTNSGGFGAGTVYLKNTQNGRIKSVILSSAGRVRIE